MKTLRGKFTLVYLGLALLAALVGLAGVWNLFRLEQSIDNLMTANYKSIDALSHMMEAIERQDSSVLLYIGVDRQKAIDLFTSSGQEFQRWLDVETSNATEPGEKPITDQLQADYNEYVKVMYRVQDAGEQGPEAAQQYYLTTVQPLFETIKDECRQLIQINEKAMFMSKQNTTDSARRSMVVLLLLSFFTMAVGYAIARYFIALFLRPIRQLSEGISRVRAGDLNQQVDVRAGDEAGRLVSDFNDMTRRLLEYEQSNIGTLMAEKNKSMAIVRSISDPLLVLDAGWRILLINDASAALFDLKGEDVTGHHFLEAIHNGALFEAIEGMAGGAEPGGRIIRWAERYMSVIATRVNDPAKQQAGTIVAFHDVTGLKELERVRTDFLATISHEFKTPLTSILMAASMLGEEGLGSLNADQQETVQAIREDGDRLLELVNDLLELMKIESGTEVYRFEPCSVHDIIVSSVQGFREAASRQGVELIYAVGEHLPPVLADAEKIGWVVNNLVGNALKHTGAGDAIRVSAGTEGSFVHISVEDSGDGIPPEYHEKIFEKFVQVGGGDLEIRGSGLGLSVARDIVRAHGGSIGLESQVGQGSTFTFTLPASEEEPK